MSLINLFNLSYFGMMVNKETIGGCVFLIYFMLFMDGWGISTPYIKTDITQTCNKNTERHQSALIEHSSVNNILSSELYFLQIKMAEPIDT